jgi:predicted nucleic acid-binding protein
VATRRVVPERYCSAARCTQVLSEDLSDGQDYGGVQVTNPFR